MTGEVWETQLDDVARGFYDAGGNGIAEGYLGTGQVGKLKIELDCATQRLGYSRVGIRAEAKARALNVMPGLIGCFIQGFTIAQCLKTQGRRQLTSSRSKKPPLPPLRPALPPHPRF